MNTVTKDFLLDMLGLTRLYNKEIILFLLVVCLICFIRIYIEFIKTEKRLNKKAKHLQYQEKIRTQETKNKKIFEMLKEF